MALGNEFFNIGYLDSLSYKDTAIHRFDPRIKIIVSILFVFIVVSFPKYEIGKLMPFFLYPVFLITMGNIPIRTIVKKLLVVSPFVVFVGIFNPFFDRGIQIELFGIGISGGWISFTAMVLKFVLTVSVALLLIATTSFIGICEGLGRLKVPEVFIVQLLFLYRYLFVLLEETFRMIRARDARSFGRQGHGIMVFASLVSVLLIRAVQRAERIYGAMVARGFQGKIARSRTHVLTVSDVAYAMICILLFIILRAYDVTEKIGDFIIRSVS